MAKGKIEFYGDAEILRKLEEVGANVEEAITTAIRKSAEKPADEMLSYIRKHRRSGRTENSWTESIKSKDGVITAEIGFSVRKGGLAAIFHNVGTPRKAPPASWFIDNAIERNLDAIIEAQNTAIRKLFQEVTN